MFLRDFRSSGTGIVVNVLYLFYNLNVNEIWVYIYIYIITQHDISLILGPQIVLKMV